MSTDCLPRESAMFDRDILKLIFWTTLAVILFLMVFPAHP